MSWLAAVGPIFMLVLLSAAVGGIYGRPLEAMILGLLGLIGFWLYQMQRVQLWLKEPKQAPPDVYGIWGELLARIYVHQRKNMDDQSRLQSTVEYLQDSFAAIRDGVVMVDKQGVITWFNHAVEPMLGLRFPDDKGQTLTNLVRSPEFNRYFLATDYSSPLQYLATVGSEKTHLRVQIARFGEGHRVLFISDVSGAVKLEKIRRDFVANVSHELRTPLTVISGYLGTFLSNTEDVPERLLKPLQQMDQQAQRMESLLKDLLWLSRLESEKDANERKPLDCGSLLQELRDELREAYPQSTIVLNLQTEHKIYGNYRQLYSAISNLAINAIKYSPEGSPVTINWSQQGGEYLLQVRDAGIGIDSVHFARLTERFYRVDDSRNTATGGTGLGLAIVKHVAAAHGAQLRIESKLGKGSTFTLVFPEKG